MKKVDTSSFPSTNKNGVGLQGSCRTPLLPSPVVVVCQMSPYKVFNHYHTCTRHTCTHMYVYTRIHVHTFFHTHVRTHVYMYTHVHTHVQVCEHTHVHTCFYTHTCAHIPPHNPLVVSEKEEGTSGYREDDRKIWTRA